MSTPKNISAYPDIIAILDTALRHDQWPATFSCASPSAAKYWRMRANSLRVALRRREEAQYGLPAGMGTSNYDLLVFSLSDSTVIINKREVSPVGALICGGEPVEVRANEVEPELPLSRRLVPDDSDPFDL